MQVLRLWSVVGSQGRRLMASHAIPAVIPLALTVICLDCERLREIGTACPCSSRTFIPLATWLERK